MNAALARAVIIAWSLRNNGDAAIIYECMADCGKDNVEVILAEPDEGVACECADAPWRD